MQFPIEILRSMLQGVKTLTVIIRISGIFLQNTSKSFRGNPLL